MRWCPFRMKANTNCITIKLINSDTVFNKVGTLIITRLPAGIQNLIKFTVLSVVISIKKLVLIYIWFISISSLWKIITRPLSPTYDIKNSYFATSRLMTTNRFSGLRLFLRWFQTKSTAFLTIKTMFIVRNVISTQCWVLETHSNFSRFKVCNHQFFFKQISRAVKR